MNAASKEEPALSVSAALALAKGALEGLTVRLVGEVSELSNKPGYKAVYFTVKDKSASLPCMMWVNRYQAAHVNLSIGQLVELTGRFSLYAAKGRMNFDVFSVVAAGEGTLRLQVAQVARKLEAEGLMDPQRKRPLPCYPTTIGVVTSPRGAAIHDVLRTLRRRFPLACVLLAGVPVEGVRAPSDIIAGIQQVVCGGAEVVLVVRGGGSFEDLMPFNDESLARAIASCPVAVVTGIGHEPDTSIADMVADRRASTPTAAAEAVSPAREALTHLFARAVRSLSLCMQHTLERTQAAIDRRSSYPILRDPNMLFASEAQGIDMLAERLFRALPLTLSRDASHLQQVRERLAMVGGTLTGRFERQSALAAAHLHDLSPLAVLGRGYAMVRTPEGVVVKSVTGIKPLAAVEVMLSDGTLACLVEQIRRIDTDLVKWEDETAK